MVSRRFPLFLELLCGFFIGIPGLAIAAPLISNSPQMRSLPSVSRVAANSAAEGLFHRGRQLYEGGRFVEAADVLEEAIVEFARQGESLNEAIALGNLSWVYQQLGRWQDAQTALDRSLSLLDGTTTANFAHRAGLLDIQAQLHLATGGPELALDTWKQVTDLYATAQDLRGTTESQINQAQAMQALGLYRQALRTLEGVQATLEHQPDSLTKAIGLRSLGNALRAIGNLDASEAALQESLNIAQRLNESSHIGQALLGLGNTAYAQQRPQAALDYYHQGAVASPEVRLQAQLNQLSVIIATEGQSATLDLVSQIQAGLSQLPPSRFGVYGKVNLAKSLMDIESGEDITGLLTEAIAVARELGDRRTESYAVGVLGQWHEMQGQWARGRSLTEEALALAIVTHADDIAYQWQWQLGRLLVAQGEPEEAIAAYTGAIDTLKTLRRDLVAISPDVRFSFHESIEPVYRELVGLLLQVPPSGSDVSQTRLKQGRDIIEALQLAELENFFREACLDAKSQQIDDLDPTAAIVYPIILADRLETIVSIPGQPLRHHSSAMARSETEATLLELRRSMNPIFSRRARLRLSQQVYNLLLEPFEENFASSGIETLVFVLDGELRNLPMAVLHDGEQYTIEKYSVAVAPGLQLLESRSLEPDRLQALTLGLTEARQGFSALPGVRRELEQIAQAVRTQIVLDRDFTRAKVREAIAAVPFPVVHLATHGQFSSNAEETFLLTWDDRIPVKDFDRLLEARSQGNSNPIELLVLSACQTAAGDRRAALGMAGVAVRSGARSTLATLWVVNDTSTAALMSEFYRELVQPGVTRAEALRRAQLSLLKQPQYKNPYFWAPFILVGNWR